MTFKSYEEMDASHKAAYDLGALTLREQNERLEKSLRWAGGELELEGQRLKKLREQNERLEKQEDELRDSAVALQAEIDALAVQNERLEEALREIIGLEASGLPEVTLYTNARVIARAALNPHSEEK